MSTWGNTKVGMREESCALQRHEEKVLSAQVS